MSWLKLAAIAGGILIAFLVVSSAIGVILGLVTKLVIAAIVVGAVVIAIKVARSGRQISRKREEREVRDRDYQDYSRPLPRADVEPTSYSPPPAARPTQDIDDELARLKREMGH